MQAIWLLSDWLRHRARLRSGDTRHAWGARGEDIAHRFLQKLGYVVVARNWKAEDGSGELDLVAWDGPSLVIVEVKTRGSTEFGMPEEAVDGSKRERLTRTAARYAREAEVPVNWLRFDIISIVITGKPVVDHIRNAFRCQL